MKVDLRPERRKLIGPSSPGYTFPEPGLLLGAQTEEKRLRYLATWLVTRSAWQRTVLQNICNPPKVNNQLWRDYLLSAAALPLAPGTASLPSIPPSTSSVPSLLSPAFTEPNVTSSWGPNGTKKKKPRGTTKAAQAKASVQAMIQLEPAEVDPQVLFFKTLSIQMGDLSRVAPSITTSVLWELCENNFRFDLLALDRLAAPHLWKDDDGDHAIMRDAQLREVFPGQQTYCVGADSLPTVNEGLAANDLVERLVFIGRLRSIEKSWPDAPLELNHLCANGTDMDTSSAGIGGSWEAEVMELERLVSEFFCQTFFDYFGRPACVPHRLFLLK